MKIIISSLNLPQAVQNKLTQLKVDERNFLYLLHHYSLDVVNNELLVIDKQIEELQCKKKDMILRKEVSEEEIQRLNKKLENNRSEQFNMLKKSSILKKLIKVKKQENIEKRILRKEGIDELLISV